METEAQPAWLHGQLTASPTVRRIALGDQAALFCERSQQLLGLNPTADVIWCGLVNGRTPAGVMDDLCALGASAADAEQFVTACLLEWLRAGRLVPANLVRNPGPKSDAELELKIDELRWSVRVFASGDLRLAGDLQSAFGQFAEAAPACHHQLSIYDQGPNAFLLLDGAPLGVFTAERVVPEVKAVVTERLSKAVGAGSFLLHTALLASGRRGLMISGAPGAGKTTLTLALASRGLGYASDDIVKVGCDGGLTGVPFSPAAKAGAWPLLAAYRPEIASLPIHLREDGQRVRYVPVTGLASGGVDEVGWVLLLDRRPGAAASLEPVEPLAVVTELLASAFAADHRMRASALEAFSLRLTSALCARLVYSDLQTAVELIERTVRAPS